MMPLLVKEAFPSEEMRKRAHDLLAQVGLTPWENNLANNMSGGQQQRVAIARALAMNPALILADEPTGNLDSRTGAAVLDLLFREQSKRKFTLVFVTHDQAAAQRAGRLLHLRDGRVLS